MAASGGGAVYQFDIGDGPEAHHRSWTTSMSHPLPWALCVRSWSASRSSPPPNVRGRRGNTSIH